MHPFVWLLLPIVITAVAALWLRHRGQAETPDDREQLARIRRSLERQSRAASDPYS